MTTSPPSSLVGWQDIATGSNPSRKHLAYKAALPHLRAARRAYRAALSGAAEPNTLAEATALLKRLTFLARTSGGTAGPDEALKEACDEAEEFLTRPAPPDPSS